MTDQTTHQKRRTTCREQLVVLWRQHSGTQAKVGALLIEVHDDCYWKDDFPSFEAYCNQELGMALRTAQHLMKTCRQWRASGFSLEMIEDIGWSKVALISGKLTEGNKDQLIADAANLSHAKLKEKYRQAPAAKKTRKPILALTTTILQAIVRAGLETETDDLQQNLEYVAERFLQDRSRAGRFINPRFSLN